MSPSLFLGFSLFCRLFSFSVLRSGLICSLVPMQFFDLSGGLSLFIDQISKGCMTKKAFVLFFVFFSGLAQPGLMANDQPPLLSEMNELAKACFRSSSRLSCQRALAVAESLQSKAELSENYACQTMALGLAADLIMSQLKSSRGKKADQLLLEVNELCLGV